MAMKQYCRYCANANWYDDFVYCHIKKKLINKTTASATNKCRDFGFNEMDVFDIEKKYKPRTENAYNGQQIKMVEEK